MLALDLMLLLFADDFSSPLLTINRCGPCQKSKPQLEALAQKYASDISKNVKFGIVYESNLGEGEPSVNRLRGKVIVLLYSTL
jgi:thiol-disulfide isomerase/thioredoxin